MKSYYKILNSLSKKYLEWDSGVFTLKDKLLPVVCIEHFRNYKKDEYIKVKYCGDLSKEIILKEVNYCLSSSHPNIEEEIENAVENENWNKQYEINSKTQLFIFSIPTDAIILEDTFEGARKSFGTISNQIEEADPDHQNNTINAFELFVDTKNLELKNWHSLKLSKTRFEKKYIVNDTCILTGIFDNHIVGMSALNIDNNRNFDGYKIDFLSNLYGFRFSVKSDQIKKIYFRVAWGAFNDSNFEDVYAKVLGYLK